MANDEARVALAQRNGRPRDMAGMKARVAGQTDAQQVYEGSRDVGKATDGSIIERGPDGRLYRYVPKFDHTMIMNEDGSASSPIKGNRLPSNSMDAYIDKVAGMAGLTDKPATQAASLPDGQDAPIPLARPDMGDTLVDDANTPNTTGNDPNADASGFSTAELLLGALGLGGAATAAKMLYNKYASSQSADDITAVADTPDQRATALEAPEEMRQITTEKQGRLPPPAQQITETKALPAPNAVDAMIDATEADVVQPDPDAAAQRFVEQGGQPANQINRFAQTGNNAQQQVIERAAALADQGDIRSAVKELRNNGIAIDDNLLRILVENSSTARTLKDRAASMAGRAAARAVSQ